MKKKLIFITISMLVLAIALTACSDNSDDSKAETPAEDITLSDLVPIPTDDLVIIDSEEILTPASQGIITPKEHITLGGPLINAYENAEPTFENVDADKPYIQFDESRYYYESSNDENGELENYIYKIVHYKEGYGFFCGLSNMSEVLGSLGAQDPKLEPVENLYFMFSKNDNTYSLTYPAGENTLKFYFTDDTLIAIVLESHE